MINFKENKQSIRFGPLDLPKLEDVLAAGRELRVMPRAPIMSGFDPRDAALHESRTGEDPIRAAVREDQASGLLRTEHEEEDLDRRMLELYRRSRTSREETGAVTLYLAVGMVEWYEAPSSAAPRHAPLMLVPIDLVRSDRGQTYRIKHAEDETRVNVTLLKKLSTEFGLDTAELEQIPEDESGLDVRWAFDRFTRLIKDKKRWDVRETAYLAEFSFAKFLMWQDLQANLQHLLANPVVKHVFDGKGAAYPLAAPIVKSEDLDAARSATELFSVVDADPSQLQAILAAEDGSSFVLQGPPGTGKSQTITNLVTQLLARGKSVLFVSEKMAALNVVHERLARVGLAPFCLELHSNQANKAAVMKQLEAPFHLAGEKAPERWELDARELETVRSELNAFADLLGGPTSFGDTVHAEVSRLIGMRSAPFVALDFGEPDAIDRRTHASMRDAVRALEAACRQAGGLHRHTWLAVRATDWTPGWQREVETTLEELATASRDLRGASERAAAALRLSPMDDRWEQTNALVDVAGALLESPQPPKALLTRGALHRSISRKHGSRATRKRVGSADRARELRIRSGS